MKVIKISEYCRRLLLIFLVWIPQMLSAQSVLDNYVSEAIENNRNRQISRLNTEKAYKEYQTAGSLYMPSVELLARYTVADGGRTIDFPVGDLLNPVYGNLNTVNQTLYGNLPAEMQPGAYPEIDNQSFNFYRPTEHETKLELQQKLFVPRVHYNRKIKRELWEAEQIHDALTESEIIAEVKKAYFQYLSSEQLVLLLEKTEAVLQENLRVQKKLFEAEKVTKDQVYISEAELYKLHGKQAEARKNKQAASAWFNFLLDKPLGSPILIDTSLQLPETEYRLHSLQDSAVILRKETELLQSYQSVSHLKTRAVKSQALPEVVGVVSYGFQGEKYEFNKNQDFVLASVVLRWPLFNGLSNSREIQISRIEEDIVQNQMRQNEQNIRLEIIQAVYSLEAAQEAYKAALAEEKSRKAVYRLIQKKYDTGQSNLLELTNARNDMTSAEINTILKKYQVLSAAADLEKAAAMQKNYPLEP